MKSSGVLVMLLGIGIFVSPITDMEFRAISLFGEGTETITGSVFLALALYLLCFYRSDDDDEDKGEDQ
jgi:hypothetical protein